MRFSRRTSWSLTENALARRLAELRAAGAPLLDLTGGNPTTAGFSYPPVVLGDGRYDPAPLGLPAARAAVAGALAERGVEVRADRLLLTASSSESYSFLLRLLCDPGDEVLVPAPSYPLLEYLAQLDDVVARPWPLVYAGEWHVDVEAVREAVGPRTRAILLVSPNNPTGSYVRREESAALESLAAERGLALIVDEVFADYPLDPGYSERYLRSRDALLFGLGGLSKSAGLPQMKLGWIRLDGPEGLVSGALGRLEIIADTFLSVGTPVQATLPALLAAGDGVRAQILGRVRDNWRQAGEALRGASANLLHVDGGWYAVVRLPRALSDEAWALAFLEDGVVVQPGWFFDFATEGHAVVSLITPPAVFGEGLARLVRRVEEVCS